MSTKKISSIKLSETDKVNTYMQYLQHPLVEVVEALRQLILSTHKEIGEEVKWNAPAFFYTGEIKPFNPKEYKRYIVVFNLFKKDCIRLLFPTGVKVKLKEKSMKKVIKNWLKILNK